VGGRRAVGDRARNSSGVGGTLDDSGDSGHGSGGRGVRWVYRGVGSSVARANNASVAAGVAGVWSWRTRLAMRWVYGRRVGRTSCGRASLGLAGGDRANGGTSASRETD